MFQKKDKEYYYKKINKVQSKIDKLNDKLLKCEDIKKRNKIEIKIKQLTEDQKIMAKLALGPDGKLVKQPSNDDGANRAQQNTEEMRPQTEQQTQSNNNRNPPMGYVPHGPTTSEVPPYREQEQRVPIDKRHDYTPQPQYQESPETFPQPPTNVNYQPQHQQPEDNIVVVEIVMELNDVIPLTIYESKLGEIFDTVSRCIDNKTCMQVDDVILNGAKIVTVKVRR
ncbi:MAG: hypothetical protein ACOCVF_04050 [bacterium]